MSFQASAFQNSAFQVDVTTTVGWVPGFRHTRKDLQERLSRQKSNTFSRRWFDEYLAAQAAALDRAENAKSAALRRALEDAVDAASEAVAKAIDNEQDIGDDLAKALNAAASASRATASIRLAQAVIDLAADEEEDDDEFFMLLH